MARLNFTTLTEAVIAGVDSAGNPRHMRLESNDERIHFETEYQLPGARDERDNQRQLGNRDIELV